MQLRMLLLLLIFSAFSSFSYSNPYADFRVKTYEIQQSYLENLTNHHNQVMEDLETKLRHQRWQTTAIAIMVFIMVSVGLYLSYLQFKNDTKNNQRSSISFRIGSGSIEFSSSVIGLAILSISFWFFQSYVNHVYNINLFNVPPIDVTTFGING